MINISTVLNIPNIIHTDPGHPPANLFALQILPNQRLAFQIFMILNTSTFPNIQILMISNISAITNTLDIPDKYLNYLKYSKDQILNPFGNLCPSSNNLNNESVCPCIQKHTKN